MLRHIGATLPERGRQDMRRRGDADDHAVAPAAGKRKYELSAIANH